MSYRVLVDDNYHYQDEDEKPYEHGVYQTAEEAIDMSQKMVDDYLHAAYKSGLQADELYRIYTRFGPDPFIEGTLCFSAWNYAKQRCEEICGASG
ncbi:hypothetical protein [uncultured Thiocystis sp.]|jgi:hypothetical protein|uniref:hypothetical protein n=1 Tax=uncultured Thiocystis sp. TaxID=1202134 RepID=UPI0025D33776|nr:hypothetical protein [uncultured Thiocystis sp.]